MILPPLVLPALSHVRTYYTSKKTSLFFVRNARTYYIGAMGRLLAAIKSFKVTLKLLGRVLYLWVRSV